MPARIDTLEHDIRVAAAHAALKAESASDPAEQARLRAEQARFDALVARLPSVRLPSTPSAAMAPFVAQPPPSWEALVAEVPEALARIP